MDYKIEIPLVNLKVQEIQKLMVLLKPQSKNNLTEEFLEHAALSLWQHLEKCLGNLDDQLLCATCFYSVISLADIKLQEHYMNELIQIFNPKSNSPSRCIQRSLPSSKRLPFGVEEHVDRSLSSNNDLKHQQTTLRVISLIYGLFQSSFLTKQKNDNVMKISQILKEMFDLLLLMGYEYSEYTFLVFKILTMSKKLNGGQFEKYIYNNENQLKLLALVNNNWESPITGVRDLNRSIFQTVISTLDKEGFDRVVKEVDSFYWNKAKFLMVSDIIDQYNVNIVSIINHKWIEGLIYSLYKPGLVSAGADMYYTVLKKNNSKEDWCELFLPQVLNILSSSNTKAINNFCNYWCLPTLKKFRTLTNILIEGLQKQNDSDQVLYSTLNILKQSNKLGIIDNNWNSACNVSMQSAMLAGIELNNTNIRMLAFEIVCVSPGKSIPTLVEYDLILDYLCYNMNSDNTVLRISMLNSLSNFLLHLNSTFKNVIIKTESGAEPMQNLLSFCRRLQNLIEININPAGNYQRKITSVKLCNTILKCFNTISNKKKVEVSLQENITLIDFLKERECWYLSTVDFIKKLICLLKDPSDDIRDNVIKLLLSYYINELQSVTLKTIVNDAKKYIQSKFFYQINCGQSMFKLITNLLLRKKIHIESDYKSVEAIFDFAFNELTTQHAAKTNVLNSIEIGEQLHSYISILLVVLEECIANSYTLTLLDHNKMSSLLEILESISNQFVWETEVSSDFSEMSDMIQNIIVTSDYNPLCKDDDAKISGLQQIVLNCLWLNVKASCSLATTLIQYNVDDVSMCERCLNIITRVLETSRHKGAIEAAGTALGKGIHYLTSLPVKETNTSSLVDVSTLPYMLLKTKLNDLISETNRMSSVTRRGAGLSIMLHRIVANDLMKGKPLFHYFIKALLQKCKHPSASNLVKTRPLYNSDTTYENMENQVDLPAAIYIHFMTRIVTDSSLATDIMYYSTELAELAFGNLTSSHWQIRNAALQLYGALVPRLIGQNKASGIGDDTIATVACDEMITHSPKLWKYITEQLKDAEGEDVLQTHSNLVPVLNMLASCAKRYHFSSSVMAHDTEIADLFDHLIILLSSPIYTLRRMTAKAIFNMYDFELISDCLLRQENVTENLLHGTLLLLNLCVSYYSKNENFKKILEILRGKYDGIFSDKVHSYLCKTLYEEIFGNDINMQEIENTIAELKGKKKPGIQIWAESRLQEYVNTCPWSVIPGLLNFLLPLCDYGNLNAIILNFLLLKLEKDNTATTDVLSQITNTLIASEMSYGDCIIWKILYAISRRADLHHCVNSDLVLSNLKGNLYNQRYIVPLIAKYIEYISNECKSILLRTLSEMSDFEISDVDMRYIAALANNELAHNFNNLPDSLKVISIKCAVFLLQDEDEDIRNLSVNFYSVLVNENRVLQPYICLTKILEKSFLNSVFIEPQQAVIDLRTKVNDLIKVNHKVDEYNPFANDSKNMYLEPYVLKNLVDKINL